MLIMSGVVVTWSGKIKRGCKECITDSSVSWALFCERWQQDLLIIATAVVIKGVLSNNSSSFWFPLESLGPRGHVPCAKKRRVPCD